MNVRKYRQIKDFKQNERSGAGVFAVLVNIRRKPGYDAVKEHLCIPDTELGRFVLYCALICIKENTSGGLVSQEDKHHPAL